MTPQDPGVYISPAQMYQEMRATHDTASRVESKVDALREDQADIKTTLGDHEDRIRGLERGRWPLPSVAVLVSLAALVVGLYGMLAR